MTVSETRFVKNTDLLENTTENKSNRCKVSWESRAGELEAGNKSRPGWGRLSVSSRRLSVSFGATRGQSRGILSCTPYM